MKTSIIKTLTVTVALILLAACAEDTRQQQELVPIKLTSDIAATRSIASPTQDTQLESGEKVYVWANIEATSGTADWTQNAYIQAWEMTADGSGNLSSSNAYYYPPISLSMVAIHGNFSTSFVEGLSPLPDFVTHTVKTDQSTLANYAVSDLLYWKQNGVTGNNNPITIAFNHKLSKIEIHLVAGDYTENELDKMTVTLRNVLPTVSMDAIDGTVGQAYGSAVSITPLKKGKVDYEAIIPPQQKPLDFIEVRYNGTVVKVDAQVNGFDSDQRYKYDFGLSNKDIRKNPLWYVAEYNVNYTAANGTKTWDSGAGTFSWASTPDEGYFFKWTDAMKYFTTTTNYSVATPSSISNFYNGTGCKFSGWHLPVIAEWWSVAPGNTSTIWTFDDGSGTYKSSNLTVKFAYNENTQNGIPEASYWKKINDMELHALRYLGTEFCSAWKYYSKEGLLVISSTLIGNVGASQAEASAWYTANWDKVYFGNDDALGAVQRCWYASGASNTSAQTGGTATNYIGEAIFCWSATASTSTEAGEFIGGAGSAYAAEPASNKLFGFHIRLFKDGFDPGIQFNDITSAHKGYYIASNGKAYSTLEIANQFSTAVGYIAYTGAVPGYFDKFIAIALDDANNGSGCLYSTALTAVDTYAAGHPVTCDGTLYNTNNSRVSNNTYDTVVTGTSNSSRIRTSGTIKGWRIPSVTDWRYIVEGMTGTSATSPVGVATGVEYANSDVLSAIKSMGGKVNSLQAWDYHTSSLYSGESGYWRFDLSATGVTGVKFALDYATDNDNYVRAVFAY